MGKLVHLPGFGSGLLAARRAQAKEFQPVRLHFVAGATLHGLEQSFQVTAFKLYYRLALLTDAIYYP